MNPKANIFWLKRNFIYDLISMTQRGQFMGRITATNQNQMYVTILHGWVALARNAPITQQRIMDG